MGGARAEVLALSGLTPEAEAEAAGAARSPLQAPAFLRALAAAGGAEPLLLRVVEDGRVAAHALLLETRMLGFGSWNGVGAPLLQPGASWEDAWEALVEAALARGVVSASWRDLTFTRLEADSLAAAQRACEARGGVATRWPFASRRVDLAPSPDALWAGMHRKHRHAARQAEAAGVRAGPVPPEGFAPAYAPLSDATWARSGAEGPPAAYFERLVRIPGVVPHLAFDAGGVPVAGAVVATGLDGVAVYLHGASSHEVSGAGTLLQWRVLQDLRARGAAAYDLGGDPLPGGPDDTPRAAGIRRFKERLGGASTTWERLHLQVDPAGYARARAAMAAHRAAAAPGRAGDGPR